MSDEPRDAADLAREQTSGMRGYGADPDADLIAEAEGADPEGDDEPPAA